MDGGSEGMQWRRGRVCVDAVRGVSAIRIEMVRIAETSPSHSL